jgi:TetR/AcrR family transcriptional regulator, lmrAB and yxaGH operons repressor
VIDDSFRMAKDWRQGATTFCYKMAKLFDILDSADACPIEGLMFDDPAQDRFRAQAEAAFNRMIAGAAKHGEALSQTPDAAHDQVETLIIGFQGSWTLARMLRRADVLQNLPNRPCGPIAQ